ncbi:helix-turn-helix domain-containing protein [Corynebacterium amycolatum]|uniref:helix-turn-helix domain-containing protein n=1 Tax=Corynebacterium amycolatum TaxID=43765 RepID=UPI000C79122B|nr:helix-turn-helix domain-containing protein [Corynebacterium amycolatum]MDK7316350.1 helix-turn-helix domain-containing protein [Corynebacterium amycolatum]PKZ20282.1 hypothetical protein CYJ43_09585 [Corynebacterium amycolatum]
MGFAEMGICVEHVHVLKPACKFTLAMLADRADPFNDPDKTERRTDGRVVCWPSVEDLARRTGQSRSTILRQLKELEQLEIIETQKRYYRDERGQGRRTTNRYILNLPDMLAGRFQSADTGLGVKMTPKPVESKPAGQSKSVKMTPKQSIGVKNGKSLSVNSDTPYNYQGLTTIPSPPSPPVDAATESGDASLPGSAEPHSGESDGSSEQGSVPAVRTGSVDAPVGDVHDGRGETFDRHRSAFSGLESAQNADDAVEAEKISTTPENAQDGPLTAISESMPGYENHNDVISDDSALVADVLPEEMQTVPSREYPRLAAAIRERLDAGWNREQMRRVLASRELPDHVRHLTALVMARFRDDLPVDNPPVWNVSVPDQRGHRPWSKLLASGRVVQARDLDMGQVAIDHHAAKAAGLDYAQGSRWAFLDAVDVTGYLTS